MVLAEVAAPSTALWGRVPAVAHNVRLRRPLRPPRRRHLGAVSLDRTIPVPVGVISPSAASRGPARDVDESYNPIVADAIAIAVIAVVFLSVAAFGAAVGYRLVQRQLSERRRALVIGLVTAAVSPILHAGAVFVWAGLLAALAAYMAGRRAVDSPG